MSGYNLYDLGYSRPRKCTGGSCDSLEEGRQKLISSLNCNESDVGQWVQSGKNKWTIEIVYSDKIRFQYGLRG